MAAFSFIPEPDPGFWLILSWVLWTYADPQEVCEA
jgi:hypothetical protein